MSRAPELPRLVNFSDSDMSTDSDEESREGSSANNVLPGNGSNPYLVKPNTGNYIEHPGYSNYQGKPNNSDNKEARYSDETNVSTSQGKSFESRYKANVEVAKSKFEEVGASRGKRSGSRGRRSRSGGRRSGSRDRRSRSRSRSGSWNRSGSRGRSRSSRRSASRDERSLSAGRRSESKGRRSRSRGRRSGSRSRRSGSRGRRSGSRSRRSGSRNRRSGSRSRRSRSRGRRSGSRSRRSRSRSRDRRRRTRSGSRDRKYRRRSRSRSRGRHRRSRSGSRRRKERRHSSPYRPRRISPPRAHKTLDTLEKLGIELKPAPPPEEPEPVIPPYYNRLAVNPAKYAQQIAKRKLIWGCKTSEEGTAKASSWQGAQFSQDQDGKMTAKFKRLMGIKQDDPQPSASVDKGQDLNKRQQELFSSMELQYEAARQATHTQRGVGLGFSSHPHHFPPT